MNNFATFDPKLYFQQPEETLYDYWLSFFPFAPAFGVDWRFSGLLETIDMPGLGAVAEPAAPVAEIEDAEVIEDEPVAEAVEKTVEAVEEVVAEAVEATEEAVEAAEVEEPAAPAAPAGLFSEAPAEVDDLTLIKGIGPKLQDQLNEVGIYTFAQIAAYGADDLEWLDEAIPTLRGRAARDNWPGQASKL